MKLPVTLDGMTKLDKQHFLFKKSFVFKSKQNINLANTRTIALEEEKEPTQAYSPHFQQPINTYLASCVSAFR